MRREKATEALNIILPWPPSVNAYWRVYHRRLIVSKAGRAYRESIKQLAKSNNWPNFGSSDVRVSAVACPRDQGRYDIDNLRKAVYDALTYAGVWRDDSQVVYDNMAKSEPGLGALFIEITMAKSSRADVPQWAKPYLAGLRS